MLLLKKLFIFVFLSLNLSYANAKELNYAAIEHSVFTDYAFEVMAEAYARIGINLKITPLPAKRSLVSANSGWGYDGELFRVSGIEKKFKNLIPIKVPLIESQWQVYSINHDFDVQGWSSLKPYTIGIRLGIVTTDQGTAGMNTEYVHSNEDLFEMLDRGRVDVIVLSKINAIKTLRQLPENRAKLLTNPVQTTPVYHFIHKKNAALANELNRVLAEMEKQGEIKKILAKHWQSLTQ